MAVLIDRHVSARLELGGGRCMSVVRSESVPEVAQTGGNSKGSQWENPNRQEEERTC